MNPINPTIWALIAAGHAGPDEQAKPAPASPTSSPADPLASPLVMTSEQAAALLGISRRTLWTLSNSDPAHMGRQGRRLPIVHFGGAVRFDRRDLLRHVGANDAADALTRAHQAAGDDLLATAAAAALLAISPRFLAKLAAAGRIDSLMSNSRRCYLRGSLLGLIDRMKCGRRRAALNDPRQLVPTGGRHASR